MWACLLAVLRFLKLLMVRGVAVVETVPVPCLMASQLEGRTIRCAVVYGLVGYDDVPILRLEMTDGTFWEIEADYSAWTRKSESEYPRLLKISKVLRTVRYD